MNSIIVNGKRYRKVTATSGYTLIDGRMVFDVHTGTGSRTYWDEVVTPPLMDCGHEFIPDVYGRMAHRKACA